MKRGDYFEHKFWRNPGDYEPPGKPLVCKVTRVTRDGFYWRPYYGKHDDGTEWLGSLMYMTNDQIKRYVGAAVHL